ncbi:MAG: amidohydrolase [Gemmatimonadetes bacterium]|nr:amidohydrolase [Gemmatimonadota bacterium]
MRTGRFVVIVIAFGTLCADGLAAQGPKDRVAASIDGQAPRYAALAQRIWDYAELGYLEERSSGELQAELRAAGFSVEPGVAGMPTAFIASWGRGAPVVGVLAEFDALPGISQDRVPERRPHPELTAGHACGHHLFGAGSVAAAIAVKQWLEASGTPGTIRLYGTPAEEGGAGKVYMVREGLFGDVDAMLHWHPGDRNTAAPWSTLSNKSAKFRFHGVSAHAAGAPEQGRSALDGVEAMNHMVNLLREHVPQETRIHYVITHGGSAPNVIPDFAEVFYYVRNPDPEKVVEIFDRVASAAEGAALGTGTRVEYEVIHGLFAMLPNLALARAMHANLERVGGVAYDAEERRFAEAIRGTLAGRPPPVAAAATVQPFAESTSAGGSTDVADVSWVVPTAGLETATWVPGTPAHSWQAIAAGGITIGEKGMINAAKALAMTAVDLFTDPELLAAAKAEQAERVGPGFVYRPLLGDRPPPLDYRLPAKPD